MLATPKPKQRLPRAAILRWRREFEEVRARGQRHTSRLFILNWLLEEKNSRRFGIIVPKPIGTAVVRNYVKRCCREAYRRIQNDLPEKLTSIWIARHNSAKASYEEIFSEMTLAYQKAGLFSKTSGEAK